VYRLQAIALTRNEKSIRQALDGLSRPQYDSGSQKDHAQLEDSTAMAACDRLV
jgi:hypothetical protein